MNGFIIAGDNFNAGYIYALLQGMDDLSSRIMMAQQWSQDVCRQLGNNISDKLIDLLLMTKALGK